MNPLIRTLRSRKAQRLASLLLSSGAFVATAQGQAINWQNGGTDANTGTAGNWSGTLGTASILTFGTASFGANTTLSTATVTNNATFTSYAGLVFNANALAYTINSTGTAVTFTGDITQNSAKTQVWNGAVTWSGGGKTLTVASGGVMQFGTTGTNLAHVINTAGTGTSKATLTGSGGEVKYLSNTSGSLNIASATSGDVDMSGLSKFTVQTGTLSIASGAVNSTGTITLSNGTSLTANTLNIGVTGGSVVSSPIVKLGTSTTINADAIVLGQTRSTGTMQFNATSGSTVVIRGTAGGTSKATITLGYYQTSPGTYNPTGTMNFNGGTVDALLGELILGRTAPGGANSGNNALNQGTFSMADGTAVADTVRLGYWSGGNTGTSGGGGNNVGAVGTLNLSGGTFTVNTALRLGDAAVANIVGTTSGSVSRGTINLSGGNLNIGVGTTAVTFLLGANSATGPASNTRGTLNITGGTLTTNSAILSNNAQSTLTLNGGTLNMGGNAIGSASTTQQIGLNGGSLNFQSGTLMNLNGINGSGGLTKTTTGTLTLLGTMAYTGATTVSDGTLRLGNGGTTGQLGNTGQDVTLTAATSILEVFRSDSASVDNKITGAGKVTVSGGVITLSNAANDYTGATTLAGGTLSISTIADGGSASGIGKSTNAASNLVFDGGTLKYTGASGSTDRNFTINGTKTATFDVTNSLTLNGAVSSGSGIIGKTGAGTLIIASTNANTGGASILNGILQVGNGGTTGALGTSGNVSVSGTGTLAFNRSDDISFGNKITGAGNVSLLGAGKVTLGNSANDYTGVTTLTSGTLSIASISDGGVASALGKASNAASNLVFDGGKLQYTGAAASTDRNFTINTGKTATFDVTNSLTLNGAVASGNGIITKEGAGTLIIAGNNGNTGVTNISTGTLQIGNGGTTGALGSGNVNNSSLLVFNRSDDTTFGNKITGNGGVQIAGGSKVTFTNAANDYTGTTNVKNGSLQLNNALTNASTLNLGGVGSSGKLILGSAGGAISQTFTDLTTTGSGGSIVGGNASNSTLTANITGSKSFGGVIGGAGTNENNIDFVKTGSGTLTLTGASTYTGTTTISQGSLVLGTGGSLSGFSKVIVSSGASFDGGASPFSVGSGQTFNANGTVTGSLNIGNGATLNGSGSVSGNVAVTNGGILAPGNSPGVLSVGGDLSYGTGAVFQWDVRASLSSLLVEEQNFGSQRGTAFDGVNVTGNLSGGGAIFRIVLEQGDDFNSAFWQDPRSWSGIFTAANIGTVDLSTIFTSFEFARYISGYSGATEVIAAPDLPGEFKFTGSTLEFAVPEPSSAVFGLLIGAGLLRRRRVA